MTSVETSVEQKLDRAFAPVARAIEAGRIPGGVLGVVDRAGNRAIRAAGQAQTVPIRRPMTENTWFDLASLTKVLFTTERILALAESGRIDLDAPLTSVLPDYRHYNLDNWERKVTFRQCLGHQTPYPAVFPLYTYGRDPDLLRTFLLQHEFPAGPAVYSDINFILLGLALERIEGKWIRQQDPGKGFAWSADPADAAATEDCYLSGGHARYAAEQDAASALFLFKVVRADLDRHSACNFAHRFEERESAGVRRDGFISDARRARLHQTHSLIGIWRQMKVSEQEVVGPQHGDFARLRFLHLYDHLRLFEDIGGGWQDRCSGLLIGLIGKIDAHAGVRFDKQLVTMGDQFRHRSGRQADSILVILDFLRHSDAHDTFAPNWESGGPIDRESRDCSAFLPVLGRPAAPESAVRVLQE